MAKNWKSIGMPSAEAGHDVKFVARDHKFHVMVPLSAHQRSPTQLIGPFQSYLGLMDAMETSNLADWTTVDPTKLS